MNDADIDNAVDAAIYGKYLHQGQICMITNRIIVHEDVYDEFTQKFVERSKQFKYGDPRDPEVVVGPLINKNQVDKSDDNINNAKYAGFDILLDAELVDNNLTPTFIGINYNDHSLAHT